MRPQLDLFEPAAPVKPVKSPVNDAYAARKKQAGYCMAVSESHRCRNCKFLRKKRIGRRNYYKCELIGLGGTPASDIRLSYVCNRFERAG